MKAKILKKIMFSNIHYFFGVELPLLWYFFLSAQSLK